MSHNLLEPLAAANRQQFREELAVVEEKLTFAYRDLYPPLSGLVRAQIQNARPHVRAAVVLTTAVQGNEPSDLSQKRIHLASALEMLFIALNIHQILMDNREGVEDTIDKSILGSTILAGDYCFSHAASLAAKTDNPAVVAIFSQTLQSISEQQLRALFNTQHSKPNQPINGGQTFDATLELFRAGIRAANALVSFPDTLLTAHEQLVEHFSAQLLHRRITLPYTLPLLSKPYLERWTTFVEWYNQSVELISV